jgi:hypothetical protein
MIIRRFDTNYILNKVFNGAGVIRVRNNDSNFIINSVYDDSAEVIKVNISGFYDI